MENILYKIRERISKYREKNISQYGKNYKDVGSGTLIMVLISSVAFVFCLGFVVDLTKNAYVKNIQNSQAQAAADSAIKTINSSGSLLNFTRNPNGNVPDAVYSVVENYDNFNSSNSSSKAESSAYRFQQCSTGNIKKYNTSVRTESKFPYMVISLDTAREVGNGGNKIVYEVEGDSPPKLIDGAPNNNVKYTVINVQITDGVGNFILGMFGDKCQPLTSNVSSITFGSQSDLSNS